MKNESDTEFDYKKWQKKGKSPESQQITVTIL